VAHYAIDSDWRFTFCNEELADRLGTTVEDVEGELLWEVFPEATDSVIEAEFREVMETDTPSTFEYRSEGDKRWIRVQAYPYADGIAAVSSDISEQRETVERILDATPVVVYRFDSDGVFQEVRGEILSRLGLEPSDLVGESIFDAYADNENVLQAAQRALDGEQLRYTLSLGDITLETQYKPLMEDGEVTSVIGVSMDVTELHRQREQMEFFNSILRHDVLNGMTVIKMRAELLADQLDGQHAQYAQTIVDWCDTTTEITKRVRRVVETLATPDEEHELEPVNVSAILQRKCEELANAYPAVTFETGVPTNIFVRADELLADVLGNVLTNSISHNDTDDLRVTTAVDVTGETVSVRIADNGVGISDERKASVFRRGETSHAKETGSGFGLFFVDVMVNKYGGDVRIEDSESGGAAFVIELPRVHVD
jgi:PAS domain S-box-containing protein